MSDTKVQSEVQWEQDFGDHTECPVCGTQCRDHFIEGWAAPTRFPHQRIEEGEVYSDWGTPPNIPLEKLADELQGGLDDSSSLAQQRRSILQVLQRHFTPSPAVAGTPPQDAREFYQQWKTEAIERGAWENDEDFEESIIRLMETWAASRASGTAGSEALEWIPVKERLPEKSQIVLMSLGRAGIRHDWYRGTSERGTFELNHVPVEQHGYVVTHWMREPKQPEASAASRSGEKGDKE